MANKNNYAAITQRMANNIVNNNANPEIVNRTASLIVLYNDYVQKFRVKSNYDMFLAQIVQNLVAAELAARAMNYPIAPISLASKLANDDVTNILKSLKL